MGEPDPNLSDDALLVLYANGNGRAVQELTMRLSPRCFGVAMRVLGNRAEAEDVTQEAMMRLWRMAPDWEPGQAKVSTWLYRVVVNAAHDRRRRAATRSKAASGWGDWELDRQAAIADTNSQLDWLTRAMQALPDDLRDTLALILDDVTHADAADILGISPGTVSWRVSEAKKHLRALKEQEDAS